MELNELCEKVGKVEENVNNIRVNIGLIMGKLESFKTLSEITPMLIRYVIFPLVSILAAGFSIERILS